MDAEAGIYTLESYAVIKRSERTAQAWEVFKRLAAQAGAAIPPQIRDQLYDYCPWHIMQSISWWIALLFQQSDEIIIHPDGGFRDHIVIDRPFYRSVDAIERCQLYTYPLKR